MKNKKQLALPTRREFLALLGAGGASTLLRDPIDILTNGLVDGIISKAGAQATGVVAPRNYVNLHLDGGPPRWYWDLPLSPYSSTLSVESNPAVVTRFAQAGANAGAIAYATTKVTSRGVTLEMPHMWSGTIPTSNGGFIPMTQLLDHMLMLRGVHNGSDGHAANRIMQTRPSQSEPSLAGLVADSSQAPIPATAFNYFSSDSYKSGRGIGLTQCFAGEPLTNVLAPFQPEIQPAAFLSRRDAIDVAMKRALESLGRYAKSGKPGAEELAAGRNKAEKLLTRAFGDLKVEYTALFDKYTSLIKNCITEPMPGITDKPILFGDIARNAAGNPAQLCFAVNQYVRNDDLRTVLNASSSTIPFLAEGFAIAEYLIRNGLSSSVAWSSSGVTGVRYQNILSYNTHAVVRAGNEKDVWSMDEHLGGTALSLLMNTFIFRSISACLYEFISVMKANNLFNDTVIQIAGDFSRVPGSLEGSDHGWTAGCTSVFSGAIQKPMVLGNIVDHYKSLPNAFAPVVGTWGGAGKVRVDGADRTLVVGNQVNTLASLLRVRPLAPNNASLIRETATGIEPTIELATLKKDG